MHLLQRHLLISGSSFVRCLILIGYQLWYASHYEELYPPSWQDCQSWKKWKVWDRIIFKWVETQLHDCNFSGVRFHWSEKAHKFDLSTYTKTITRRLMNISFWQSLWKLKFSDHDIFSNIQYYVKSKPLAIVTTVHSSISNTVVFVLIINPQLYTVGLSHWWGRRRESY